MKQELKYLVIHCTATPEGREVTADQIRAWHTAPPPNGRGWRQVGYTDLIHLNGVIERMVSNNEDGWVDSWEITNGATGYNGMSRHIVYVGGCDKGMKPKDTRTEQQKYALKQYVLEFHAQFPNVKIIGHNEVAAKACPSFNVKSWLESIGIKQ